MATYLPPSTQMLNTSGFWQGNLRERPRRWWEDIRVDLKEIDWKGADRIHLAQDRVKWWAVRLLKMRGT